MRKTELSLSTENIQKLVLAFNNAERSNPQLLGGQVARMPLETFLYTLSFIQDEHHRLPIEEENILNFEALVVYDLLERGVVDRAIRRQTPDASKDNTQLPDAVNLLEQHLDNIQERVGENEFIGKRLPTIGMELELPEADIEDRRGPLELLETLSDFRLFSFEIEQIFNGITHEENSMELRTSAFHSLKMLKSIFTIIDRMGAFDNYPVVPHITYASEYLDLFPGKSEAVIFTLMLFAGGLIPLPRKLLRQFATENRLYREEYSKASFLGQEFEDGETVRIPFKTRRTFGSELKNVYGDHTRIGGFEAREMPEYPYPWINFVMRNSELVLPFVYAANALYKPVSLQTAADKIAALEWYKLLRVFRKALQSEGISALRDEDIFIPQGSIRFQLYQNIEQTKIDEQISDFITWTARKEKKEFRRDIAKAVAGFAQVVKNAYLNESGIQI